LAKIKCIRRGNYCRCTFDLLNTNWLQAALEIALSNIYNNHVVIVIKNRISPVFKLDFRKLFKSINVRFHKLLFENYILAAEKMDRFPAETNSRFFGVKLKIQL